MRRSLGGDEDQGAEESAVMRDRRRRARCVPDRPVNAGYLRSLADSPIHRLTCVYRQADPLRKPTSKQWVSRSAPGRYPRWLAHHSRAVASVSAACGTCSAASVSAIMSRAAFSTDWTMARSTAAGSRMMTQLRSSGRS